MNLQETFRAFAEPSRRILHLLLQQPLCVCHLQELLDLPQVNVSQHLAYLRKAGLVEEFGKLFQQNPVDLIRRVLGENTFASIGDSEDATPRSPLSVRFPVTFGRREIRLKMSLLMPLG